uniref:Uncharacterized protein n=1 Tax=Populus alba TaxID=43335 RepID=A0A4U5QRI8_POPAL|nr:hypothetical protein D5086_0000054340 [Populus alba]
MPSRNELYSEYPSCSTAEDGLTPHQRDPIKSSVGNVAANRSRQNAVALGKERRESAINFGGSNLAAVQELKSAVVFQGKGAMKKLVGALRELRCLLSKSEFPPLDAALKAGAIALLVQCLSFGSPDEQLLEAAQSLTNIAAGKSEETKALLSALLLLIAHLGGEELRSVLLTQGALPPLARMMLPYKGSTVRTAAWALSNLIKG